MACRETPVKAPKSFRIIAHRGASGYAPENTLSAFELAARMGVTEIEYDLQFSKDRRLVVVHDTVLDRYGHPGLKVSDLTLADLKKLEMGAWFDPRFAGEKIVTLDELLARFGDSFIHHAEIKAPAPGLAAQLLKTFDAHRAAERAIITSFAFDALLEVRALRPDARVGWLVAAGAFVEENTRRAAEAGFFQFCPRAGDTSRQKVAAAKAVLSEVRAHGVRSRADLRQAIEAGCDGATVNWPDWVAHA